MEPRILIVDNEPVIVRLCEQLLSHASYQVTSATDPITALELLAQSKFDLLLVDIRMPLMDGFELAYRARQVHPGLATLAMTGFGTVDVAIEAMHKGMDGLIIKPFQNENLVATVRQTLEEKKIKIETNNTLVLQPLIEAGHKLIGETNEFELIRLVEASLVELLNVKFVAVYSLIEGEEDFRQITHNEGPFPWKIEDLKSFKELTAPQESEWILPAFPVHNQLFESEMSNLGWGSCIIASVIRSKEIFLFCVGRSINAPVLSEKDYSLLIVFARQAVIALVNSRLYAEIYGKKNQGEFGPVIPIK
jgi:CheY-like chemotaxis protein